MQTAMKLPLRSLNPNLISDLQEKYPEAELHIVIADASDQPTVMNENRFWDIVSLVFQVSQTTNESFPLGLSQ